MIKIVKAKKPWKCDHCGSDINVGEKYQLQRGRAPDFDDDDKQCGIVYWVARHCFDSKSCVDRYEKENDKELEKEK